MTLESTVAKFVEDHKNFCLFDWDPNLFQEINRVTGRKKFKIPLYRNRVSVARVDVYGPSCIVVIWNGNSSRSINFSSIEDLSDFLRENFNNLAK